MRRLLNSIEIKGRLRLRSNSSKEESQLIYCRNDRRLWGSKAQSALGRNRKGKKAPIINNKSIKISKISTIHPNQFNNSQSFLRKAT
jgi:hypothetical protein